MRVVLDGDYGARGARITVEVPYVDYLKSRDVVAEHEVVDITVVPPGEDHR